MELKTNEEVLELTRKVEEGTLMILDKGLNSRFKDLPEERRRLLIII